MNLNKLSNGQVVKNYKTMCEILEEPYMGGKSRVIQLDKWRLYFDYGKDGVKFIINDIYTQEKTNKLKQALDDVKRNKIENRKKETQRKKDLEKKEKEQEKEIKRKERERLNKEKEERKKLREQRKLEREKLNKEREERRKLREQKKLEKEEKQKEKEIKRKERERLEREKEERRKLREQKKLEKLEKQKLREQKKLEREKLEEEKEERRKLREQKKLEKEEKQKEREERRKEREKLGELREQKKLEKEEKRKEKEQKKLEREQKKLEKLEKQKEKEQKKLEREQKKLEKEEKQKLSKERRENGLSNLLYNNICCVLNKYKEDKIVLTKSKLLKDVGMINDKFGMKLSDKELEKINSNQFNYNEFNKIVLSRISSTLDYVFKKMSNDCLIKRDTYLLRYDNHEFYDLSTFREVDMNEEYIIKDIYNQVLAEFELEKEADLMYKSNSVKESFYAKVSEEINNRFDCNGHCKAYDIQILNRDKLKNKTLDKRRLNNTFVTILKDTIKNKYTRTNNKGMIMLSENNDKAFMYDNYFLSNQYDLLNKFIRLNN